MMVSPGLSFGVAAEHQQTLADYGFVGLRMTEIVSWHIDGLLESSDLIGPWLEAQDAGDQESAKFAGPSAPLRHRMSAPTAERLRQPTSCLEPSGQPEPNSPPPAS